jgi:hypothetical protein
MLPRSAAVAFWVGFRGVGTANRQLGVFAGGRIVGCLWCTRPWAVMTGGARAPCGSHVTFECSLVRAVMHLAGWCVGLLWHLAMCGVSACFSS